VANFLLILWSLGSGFALRKFCKPLHLPENTHQGINTFVLYVSLPAMALYYVPKISFSVQMFLPFSVGFLILMFSFAFFKILQKWLHYNQATLGALVLSCGFGNVSFMGYPLVEAFYGKKGIETAILIDQGTFLVLATLGITSALYFSGKQPNYRIVLKKLFYFPSFGAFMIGLMLMLLGSDFPLEMQNVLKRLADTLSPLALFSVGWQISWQWKELSCKEWSVGLLYKLWVAPFLFYVFLYPTHELSSKVIVLEASMAPMITSSLIAADYGLHPKLCNFLVAVGIPLSLLTVSVWYWWML
jgi:predicted permease